jgi:DnaJ-class molecular chaperone
MSAYQLYSDLGLSKTATEQDIKKQYRTLARQHHPDKGGDGEKFKKISHAYEILSNSEKKKKYDMMGGQEQSNGMNGGGGFPFENMPGFGNFGNGMFQRSQQRSAPNIKPSIHRVDITLDDIYTGIQKTILVHHTILCGSCTGTGTIGKLTENTSRCKQCGGSGQETHMRSLGPGMMQQISQQCTKCTGSGRFVSEENKCRACTGNGYKKTKSQLTITIPPGATNETIVHRDNNKGGHVRDSRTNKLHVCPLLVMLRCSKHPTFQRCAEHLTTTLHISVWEALCGIDRVLKTISGKVIQVQTTNKKICSPGMYLVCKDEGLPWSTNSTQFGSLFLKIDIQFPTHLTDVQQKTILSFIDVPKKEPTSATVQGQLFNDVHVSKMLAAAKERAETAKPQQQQQQQQHQQFRHSAGPECATQ